MTRILMRYPEGKGKALTFSYDDGVYSDIRFAKIMDEYGLRATFNINGGLFCNENDKKDDPTRRMTKKEAYDLYANSRHEVALHGYLHCRLKEIPNSLLAYEYVKDREVLEGMFDRIVRGMAYPYGHCNEEIAAVVRDCGIAYGRTVVSTEKFELPQNWLLLNPTCHHKNPRLMELAAQFNEKTVNPWESAMLFYVWGHTYEFERENNWNVIEEFAKEISGKDDTWYATNIEIYEYIEAYKRLRVSIDSGIVMNPSSIPVWFVCVEDFKVYKLEPGETVRLISGEHK